MLLDHTTKPRTFAELRKLTGLDHADLNAEITRHRRAGALRTIAADGVNDRAVRFVNVGVIVRPVAPVIVRACELVELPPGKRRSHNPGVSESKWRQGEIDRGKILDRLRKGNATADELGNLIGYEKPRMEHQLKSLQRAGKIKTVGKRGRWMVWAIVEV